jgi:general stress protein YciG
MNEATAPRKRPQTVPQNAAPMASAPAPAATAARTKARRGFAVMDKTRQREIASAGGRAAHARGNAHEFTSDEAREAGRKGGRSVSNDKVHMASIGRKGGIERGKRHAQRAAQKKAAGTNQAEQSPRRRLSPEGASASA